MQPVQTGKATHNDAGETLSKSAGSILSGHLLMLNGII
ncbi:hypothetical protein GMES_2145 [Paraglaciecola mesophila KMM 241]|uniref:Uncharacterized protein n=1 Tax=Paraglaciecola mesophila KMM 241 TaxID=1128912 RepID=K6YKC4_9ALTE|nr:hypothetical protein GMES_2145 [Paraglaciecola mesophila KMM 241]